MWILVRQEVHTLGIGTGNARASRTAALALIYPNPLPYFLPDQYPLRNILPGPGPISQHETQGMALATIAIVLALLFAFVDVWYFVRFFLLLLRVKLKRLLRRVSGGERMIFPEDFLSREYGVYGIVLPSDLDWMCHMNNSKYLREMDFGRVGLTVEWGLGDVLRKLGAELY